MDIIYTGVVCTSPDIYQITAAWLLVARHAHEAFSCDVFALRPKHGRTSRRNHGPFFFFGTVGSMSFLTSPITIGRTIWCMTPRLGGKSSEHFKNSWKVPSTEYGANVPNRHEQMDHVGLLKTEGSLDGYVVVVNSESATTTGGSNDYVSSQFQETSLYFDHCLSPLSFTLVCVCVISHVVVVDYY